MIFWSNLINISLIDKGWCYKIIVTIFSHSLINKNKKIFKSIYSQSIKAIPVRTLSPESLFIKKKFKIIKDLKFDYILDLGGGKTIDTAKLIKREVCDGIIAPGFTEAALEILKSKIHRATVTEANLDYIGSLTLDEK